jgi:geranylgeranyl diphosphate synthase type II
MDFEAWAAERRDRVEEALQAALAEGEVPLRLREAMGYLLLAGGKRLRPLLTIGAAEAVGGDLAAVLPVAVALEMIHTYSLLHDDLPCMDDDDLRRGRPTCHRVFGEALAVLAGDALLTRAFEVASRAAGEAGRAASIVGEIARGAGPAGMVGGQVLDLEGEDRRLTLEEVERMHALKTGALFVASVRAGALCAGAGDEAFGALSAYARALGLAFQVTDDLLDVLGDRRALGKPVGGDAAKGKSTFPALLGVEQSRQRARALVREATEALATFGPSADPLRALAALAVERDR